MVIYNKIYEKKDGRKLVAGGPRDFQKRQNPTTAHSDVSNELDGLRKEIKELTSGITTNSGQYTKQQIDDAVNLAIEEVSIDLEKKYVVEINTLKSENSQLKILNEKLGERIDKKDDVILELTTKLSTGIATITQPGDVNIINDRPTIDAIFIDPAEKGAEDKFESHVITKETKSLKPDVLANVNKLKNLMGKLPK